MTKLYRDMTRVINEIIRLLKFHPNVRPLAERPRKNLSTTQPQKSEVNISIIRTNEKEAR